MNQTTALPELLAALCSEGSFQKMIFSDKRRKSIEYQKVTLRPILVGGQPCCQATYTYPKKVTHRNLPFAETAAFCMTLCEEDFKQINIFTQTEQLQVLAATFYHFLPLDKLILVQTLGNGKEFFTLFQ